MLEGFLDEPLVLVRGSDAKLRCLSNVCTHRGNLVVTEPCQRSTLVCAYHGRRFHTDGRLVSSPEFEGAADFPSARDDLPEIATGTLGPFAFAALDPALPFDELVGALRTRMGAMPLDELVLDPSRSRDYEFAGNWALYCDNFLEGFHIPYLHASLNAVVNFDAYTTELFAASSLQLALAKDPRDAFDLPASSPDHGKSVAAYYWWLFPNVMLNFYPWGISVNLVQPLAVDRTRVSFWTYVWDPKRLDRGAGSGLDRVEHEDEAVVEAVQRGVRSRLYHRGRYSPTREQGVHHFHRLLAERLR
jgi:choline monooxygenase